MTITGYLRFAGIIAAALPFLWSMQSRAGQIIVDPVDDGYIQAVFSFVDTSSYLLVAEPSIFGEARGVVEFPTSGIGGNIAEALLSVNAYGLPLFLPDMRVFGYESENGQLDLSDYDSGDSLGVWTLPSDLTYGVQAFFDVTDFLRSVQSPYVGFRLEGIDVEEFVGATNVFSSLEFNLGAPAQLIVTSVVPEPASLALLGVAFAGLGFSRRRELH